MRVATALPSNFSEHVPVSTAHELACKYRVGSSSLTFSAVLSVYLVDIFSCSAVVDSFLAVFFRYYQI